MFSEPILSRIRSVFGIPDTYVWYCSRWIRMLDYSKYCNGELRSGSRFQNQNKLQQKRTPPPIENSPSFTAGPWKVPETWLWTEQTTSNTTGQKTITVKVPDTITSWYTTAFAMSSSTGMGVADPSTLRAFQPLFVSFTLPYSVVRGEQVSVVATVFNYMSRCSSVRISLTKTDHFQLSSPGDQNLCVCGNEAKSVNLKVYDKNIPTVISYVQMYLNSTNQNTDEIHTKAVDFLRTGYQRELTYKHNDGSYSAYGEEDAEGSLWLTAFVLRSFSQARQFIFVDEKEIVSITRWIKSKQLDTGCFEKYGELFVKELKGGVSTSATLTAYVVISLLESKVNPKSNVIVRALECITAQKDSVTDSYSNAIIAYALTLARHQDHGKYLTRLKSQATVKGD
ncbi:hypothetical protein QZH41_007962 [Actinostola sp. cb2023]|nr:hypothetical protein QZH41_007962 [Actinostola sp. cb2023]